MVFPDFSASNTLPKNAFKAPMLDRLMSFFLDYLIFSPFIQFFLVMIFFPEYQAWRASRFSAETAGLLAGLAIHFVIFFSLLQTFFIYRWKATPGQYFLKLETRFEPSTENLFLRIFFRQLGFWFSILGFGIPWLAVLAHDKGRTFYDRMVEAQVVSLKHREYYFGFEKEAKYWRSLSATLTVFVATLFVVSVWSKSEGLRNGALTLKKLESKNYFCAELKDIPLKERLQTVVALNLIGQIADDCVDKEADFVLWKSSEAAQKSLAYYAKSLTESDETVEVHYMDHACHADPQALGCRVASGFKNDNLEGLLSEIKNSADKDSFLSHVLRYELSVLLDDNDHSAEYFEQMKKFDSEKSVKKYLISEILRNNRQQPQNARQPAANSKVKTEASEELQYAEKLISEL